MMESSIHCRVVGNNIDCLIGRENLAFTAMLIVTSVIVVENLNHTFM